MTVIDSVPQSDNGINNSVDRDRMKKAAIGYAQLLKWHVFPVHSIQEGKCTCGNPKCRQVAKHPITKNGLKDATNDIEVIAAWWDKFPWANIAICTGRESGIFVLDVDTKGIDGRLTLERLTNKNGSLPDTVQAITGSGGEHYLFKYQEGIGNKVNFQPSLDIRGDGGYIVAPMSTHASGNKYEWELSSRPLENEIANAPEWLIKMITQPFYTHNDMPQPKPSSHWAKLMHGLSEGEGRNPAAASIMGHLLRKRVDPYLAIEIVNMWNERNNPPLDEYEMQTTISSIMRKEAERRGI